jgi:8-oxo-dGTP pyrophosphatase MutT (NUDIX family)
MNDRAYRRPDKVIVYLYRRDINGGPEYLLLQRAPSGNAGSIWQTVVGTVKWEEERVEAARREVYEEIGLTSLRGIMAIGYAFSFPLHLPKNQKSRYAPHVDTIRNTVYAAEVQGTQTLHLSEEHVAYQWFPYPVALERIHWPEEREALIRLHPMLYRKNA